MMYNTQAEALGSTSNTELQLLYIPFLEECMPLPYTEVLEERGDPLTKWVIYKEWLVYKLIKLILSQSCIESIENQSSYLLTLPLEREMAT